MLNCNNAINTNINQCGRTYRISHTARYRMPYSVPSLFWD